jgi:hypothetical protein
MASVRCWLQLIAGPCREMEVRLVKAARKAGRLGQVLRGQAAQVQDRRRNSRVCQEFVWSAGWG